MRSLLLARVLAGKGVPPDTDSSNVHKVESIPLNPLAPWRAARAGAPDRSPPRPHAWQSQCSTPRTRAGAGGYVPWRP
ncbi:hypothetical protein SSCG_02628 [Streptomyces clavuligerus]|nr:hypothetical protein SSCG_02628 [Streptomyces clavuligerus]